MARLNATQFAEKWARRSAQASADFASGVASVTEAPGAKAAQAAQLWQSRVQESAGKWASKVGAVSLSDWKNQTMTVGQARFAQGVQASQSKVERAAQRLLPMIDAAVASLPADKSSLEARIQRSTAFQRKMAEQARTR